MTEKRDPKYKVGDKVTLIVGGPDMVVDKVNTDHRDTFAGSYRCIWFAGKKLDWGNFPEEGLEEAKNLPSAADTSKA